MILAADQPAYLPRPDYLARIAAADVFVILDSGPIEKDGVTHRSRIKTPEGESWLTVPLQSNGNPETPIYEIKIDRSHDWRDQHARSIQQAYVKAPAQNGRLEKLATFVRQLDQRWVSPLCRFSLKYFLSEYGIPTRVQTAPIKKNAQTGTKLILELCAEFGADTYLSGPSARSWLDLSLCEQADIKVIFQEWRAPVYPQLHGQFIPDLSVVDLWLNTDSNPFSSLLRAKPGTTAAS